MPINQLQRTDSWPPTVVRLSAANESKDQGNDTTTLRLHNVPQTIDEEEHDSVEDNPFSYFLSSPEDSDDDEDLNAGIETPETLSTTPIIRTVSPSDFQRQNTEEILSPVSSEEDYIYDAEVFDSDEFDVGIAVPLTLREFSASQAQTESRPRAGRTQSLTLFPPERSNSPESSPRSSGSIKSHVRGRNPVVHRPVSLRRLRADTYPVRRPHSWRRPSDDVWTIPEESSSASNSSKESLEDSKDEVTNVPVETQVIPSLTLTVPATPFNPAFAFEPEYKNTLTPPLKLSATMEGEDPSQIAVFERKAASPVDASTSSSTASSTPRLYSALGSPTSPISQENGGEEERRSLALARVTDLEEAPFPQEPVLRLPLRRRKTVRFVLPEEN